MSGVEYYIATTVNGREYVVLLDSNIVAGSFETADEAVKARNELEAETEAQSA